jgi:hypothetical protein
VRGLCEQAAARTHQLPDGRYVRLSWRTIETWYYAHKRGGFDALMPERRSDRGRSRALSPELAELILRAKREKPRRSVRRIIRMLELANYRSGKRYRWGGGQGVTRRCRCDAWVGEV